jgi:hypothetical protein
MVFIRYIFYLVGIALITWLLTSIEVAGPGGLKLYLAEHPGDVAGTSEFSPIEHIQAAILLACGMMQVLVARNCPPQRPIALLFAGLALIFLIRELNYFFDLIVVDNLWQILIALIAATLIVYTNRHWLRFRIAWLRVWPSPGLVLLYAGTIVIFVFVPIVGRESLWMALMGDQYMRIVKLAVEEMTELLGYLLWLIGTIEYAYQSQVMAEHGAQTAAAKKRAGRQPKSMGRF